MSLDFSYIRGSLSLDESKGGPIRGFLDSEVDRLREPVGVRHVEKDSPRADNSGLRDIFDLSGA